MKFSKKIALQVFLFTLILKLSSQNSYADGSTADTSDPAIKPERVEVLGSHIKRVDVEGVSPIQTVTAKDIEKKGYDNLGDAVRDLGVNSFGSGTVSGNSTAPGNADINLRGLGSDNTLVLLDGHRLPQDAVTGTVDLNLIPIAAVERIEILKDGASAVYGSDALGGVVNIITRKDFKGTEISGTGTSPTNYSDGRKVKINLVNGINDEKFNMVTSVGLRYDQPVYSKNRPWSSGAYSMTGNPPSYANNVGGTDGTFFTTASCPPELLTVTPAGTFCRFKYSDYSEEAPQVLQGGLLSTIHYDVNPDTKINARIGYVHRDVKTVAAPSPGNFSVPASALGGINPNGWDGVNPLDVNLRLTSLGPRDTDVNTNSYSGLVGVSRQLGNDWQLDIDSTFDLIQSHLEGTSGFALITGVQNLVNTNAFNPFSGAGDLSSAAYKPYENTKSLLTGLEVKASGDLFETGAGPVGLAIGSLANYALYSDITDDQTLAGNVFGNAGSSGGGHRSSEALYSELSIPLVKKKLELQLAGRGDHYSDFGTTVNPKVGLLYHATPTLLFRSTAGTGFRAPLLSELYAGQSIGYPSFIDAKACAQYPGSVYCQAQQYQVTSGGNPNLKQEKSQSVTFGTIFSPTSEFNIGGDFFFTKISNMPGIDYNDMTLAQKNGVNPANYGVIITRDANGIIQSVVAPLQNLSSVQEAGVDISTSYTAGKFKFSTEQNQLFFYKTEGFPGSGLVNKLGWNGNPAWRNATSIGYNIGLKHDLTATALTIPGQRSLDQLSRISSLTTYDLSYVYKMKKGGSLTASVINILNSKPPYDYSNPTSMVNYSLYDMNGRQIVFGYQGTL